VVTFYRICRIMGPMTPAFAYLRVSGKGQIAGDGFPRQEAAVRAYVKRHRIEIVRVFKGSRINKLDI
jgi:DNA invertase Pin-like site-specific DNA recombinase